MEIRDPHGAHAASYARAHVFSRCGQAVTLLAEAGLIAWPVQASEEEVNEWWLVSDALAARLLERGATVLRFGELNLWGRHAAGTPLEQDMELLGTMRE